MKNGKQNIWFLQIHINNYNYFAVNFYDKLKYIYTYLMNVTVLPYIAFHIGHTLLDGTVRN